MIDKKNLANLKVIADEYGYENQSMQLIEEMAELTQAINKYRRYGTYEKKCQIIEEIADVSIMLEQVSYLLPVNYVMNIDEYIVDTSEGYGMHSRKLIWKMAELTQVILECRRSHIIIQIIADLSILLERMFNLLQVDKLVFDTYVEDKIDREMKRMETK